MNGLETFDPVEDAGNGQNVGEPEKLGIPDQGAAFEPQVPRAHRFLERVANVRMHGTTRERPRDRFDREERLLLQPLTARRYTSLIVEAAPRSTPACRAPRPVVTVGRRALAAYAQLAGGAA